MSSRIALYWHNGRSLGHTAESAVLAHALVPTISNLAIAGITGASKGLDMFPNSMDIVKLPSFRNYDTPTKTLMEPVLPITERELFRMREDLICTFMQNFRPQLFVINHLPLGTYDELVPAITRTPFTKKILTLRGILFSPERTNAEYFNPSMISWIDEHFTEIHIHTDPAIFRLEDHYSVHKCLSSKFVYTGYMAKPVNFDKTEARRMLNLDLNAKVIVVSMGGGQGAQDIWLRILEALIELQRQYDVAYLITGPYLEENAYFNIKEKISGRDKFILSKYEQQLITWMKACDVFIGAGGANMLGEVLANRINAVIIPRQLRESEQEIHANLLAKQKIIRKLNRLQLEQGLLNEILKEALNNPLDAEHQLLMNGAERSAELIKNLLMQVS